MLNEQRIHAITRPDAKLLTLYIIRSILSGPFIFLVLPLLYFRYHTMRYRIDNDGISMKWGILFRKEVNLTYARIQDIHVTSASCSAGSDWRTCTSRPPPAAPPLK